MAPKIPTTDPEHLAALRRRGIKDPGTDPTIAMTRDRRQKELANENQKLLVAGLVGTVLHKDLELQALMKDIATLEEGVQEYQDRIDLLPHEWRDCGEQNSAKALCRPVWTDNSLRNAWTVYPHPDHLESSCCPGRSHHLRK